MSFTTENASNVGEVRTAFIQQIENLLGKVNPAVLHERRQDERLPIPVLFRLTPLEPNGRPIADEVTTVVGKNISRRGISFFHERPLPHRRAQIELVQPGMGEFAAEVDVKWCRFLRPGWYESGGRLIRAVTPNNWAAQ